MTTARELVRQVYRAAVMGTGTVDDPYRPWLPVELQPGDGWAAQVSFGAGGEVEVEVVAGSAVHEALAAAPGVAVLVSDA